LLEGATKESGGSDLMNGACQKARGGKGFWQKTQGVRKVLGGMTCRGELLSTNFSFPKRKLAALQRKK